MTIRVTTRGAGAWVLLVVMGGCATPTPVPIDDARVREEPTALPDAAGIDAPEAPADATADVPMDVAVDVPADTTSPSDSMDAEAAVPDAETAVPDAETAVPDADAAVPDAETAVPDADAAVPDADAPETEPMCPTPLLRCAGACIDPSTDPTNCGGCGAVCPSGTVCVTSECGPPRVYALHPPLVDGASGRLVLEGAFGRDVEVTFPGSTALVAMTALGPGRVEVRVPPDATAGALRVRTAGATVTSSIRFRRTSFSLGLQPFRARYEQADYARQTPSLTTARVHAATFQSGLWLYLLGGADASGAPLHSIERAMINADGTLGAFQTTGATLGAPREGAAAVRVGDAVYLLGGAARGTRLSTIERATVSADGAIGAFTPFARGLRAARAGHAVEVIGSYVYVFGGGSTVVERAPIDADGTLGAFTDTSVRTLEGRGYATSQVIGGSVFLLGGMNGDTASRTVERAEVRGNGAVTPFAMAGTLRGPRAGAASMVLGNRVFVAGGTDGASALGTLERADIGADGSLSAFATYAESTLSRARHGASAAQVGNYWYLVGGAGSEALRGIDRAEVNGSGLFGTARNLPRPGLAGARVVHSVVAIGPYLYVIGGGGSGGFSDPRNTERALVLPDGSPGPFTPYAPESVDTRYRSAAEVAIVGSSLYVIGGRSGTSEFEGAMLRIQINDDASLGPATPMPAGTDRSYGRALVLDDRVCVFGGGNRSGLAAAVTCAGIGPAGAVTMFSDQPARLPAARNYAGVALLDDGAWVVGGTDGTSVVTTTFRCATPLGAADCANVSATTFGSPREIMSGVIVGNALVFAGGWGSTSEMFLADAARLPITASGSLASSAVVSGFALALGIHLHATIVVDNNLWLIGGNTALGNAESHQRVELR